MMDLESMFLDSPLLNYRNSIDLPYYGLAKNIHITLSSKAILFKV